MTILAAITNSTGEPAKPHYVIVPLLAQGHMIPMIDLARRLAERGILATVITTPFNAARVKITADRAKASGLPLRFVSLHFPCAEFGLPEGCENLDVVPAGLSKNFFDATNLLGPALEAHLRAHGPSPTCIISDAYQPWTLEVAQALGVPLLTFYGICCFSLLIDHNNARYDVFNVVADNNELIEVPGMAHRIEVTRAVAPGFFDGPQWAEFRAKVKRANRTAVGIVVNSFRELESWYVDAYERAMDTKVWVLGPLGLSNKEVVDVATRGNEASIDTDKCVMWLDMMEPGSVVYVSFGSLAQMRPAQLKEVGLGLEACGRPFIWVVKEVGSSPEIATWLSDVFEERVKPRGLVIKGWAPQVMILTHRAVGGFMTHCGWNSSLEGLAAGVPMMTWPFFGDQFLNEKMIVEVLRTGVSVGVEGPDLTVFGLDVAPTMMGRAEVERVVRRVMGGGVEAEERRERAKELGKKAREAVEEGGSSHLNMTFLCKGISKVTSHRHEEVNDI